MSCNGCIYTVGKDATCNLTYACNTSGDRPTPEEANRKRDKKQENQKSNRRTLRTTAVQSPD